MTTPRKDETLPPAGRAPLPPRDPAVLDIDEAKVARYGVRLWLGWTLATTAGMLLGLLPFTLFLSELNLLLGRFVIPLWTGFLVGLFQWLALRRYLTHSADWILNGGLGWALGFALGLLTI